MDFFQTPSPDYSGMSEDEIYHIGEKFEERLSELLKEHESYYHSFPFFRSLKEGHQIMKKDLKAEEKEVV